MNNPSRTSNMFIATLDILGITQMMCEAKNNELDDIASNLREVLTSVSNRMKSVVADATTKVKIKDKEVLDEILNTIRFNIFSDTVVIGYDMDHAPENYEKIAASYFMAQVRFTAHDLFEKGYPSRGCIDFGPVHWEDDLVIGNPYANSYKVSESLDFSGVVITEEAFKVYDEHYRATTIKFSGTYFKPLPVPLKTGGFREMINVNWIKPTRYTTLASQFENSKDLRQLLYEKFAANGKTMTESALRKMANTENVIRAFIMQNKTIMRQKENNSK